MSTAELESAIEPQDVQALKAAQLTDLAAHGLPSLGSMALADTTAIAASRLGVGFETLDRQMFKPEKVYPLMAKLGAKLARVQTGWSRCETVKGTYDFDWLEEIVDRLAAAGVDTLFSVSFGNRLYMPDAAHESAVGQVPTAYGPEVREAWTNYVRALARRFRGKVPYWEIWNEPNIPQFWHPGSPNAAEYVGLVTATAPVIREEAPEARIVGGAMSKMDPPYLEGLMKAGLAAHIDAFSFHPYQSVPEHNLQNMHDLARRLLDAHSGGRRIELWQGENGCPSQTEGHNDDWLGLYATDQVVQAKWVARRLLVDRKIGFDRALYFHTTDLMEQPYRQAGGAVKKPVMMGLIHGLRYEPKVSFDVYRHVASLFDEASERRELFTRFFDLDQESPQQATLMGSPMAATFVRHGAPLFAYWMAEDPQQKRPAYTIDLVVWCDSDLTFTRPVLVDLMTGTVHDAAPVAEPFEVDSAVIGTRFRVPLTDYPLVITDASLFPEVDAA